MQVTIASRLARMQVEVTRLQAVRVAAVVRQQLVDRRHGHIVVMGAGSSSAAASELRRVHEPLEADRHIVQDQPAARLPHAMVALEPVDNLLELIGIVQATWSR